VSSNGAFGRALPLRPPSDGFWSHVQPLWADF
jgi:hypothetical protein